MRDGVAFAITLAVLYEILCNQTGDKFYRFARKIFYVAACLGAIIEIARLA